ncbi:MAG: response regulator [Calditrichaeota bacterium]|nr:response regulator [Candidatus Cloacimonadota bacterium]MCA9785178.1 response regulator [Candidatus Cloacimonadota bacterium]MCB1045818.1 response regulator [Calditrichota bacterium]MCB9473839.1 response regulator [Candidatus Delongbacteria bacterium]
MELNEDAPLVGIIDDDEVGGFKLEHQLQKRGFRVCRALSAEEGFVMLRAQHPDVVITDWVMPGMSGPELCRLVKDDEDLKETYLITITAKSGKEDLVSALDSGSDDFIQKPFDKEEVFARIRSGLRVRFLQKELARSRHLQGILQTAVTIQHEINNPLAVIQGRAELLQMELNSSLTDQQQDHLTAVLSQCRRIRDAVKKLSNLTAPVIQRHPTLGGNDGGDEMIDLGGSKASLEGGRS